MEVSIIFVDPISLSQGEEYDFVIVKAWSYEILAKLDIPLQVYSETKLAQVIEGTGTAVNYGMKTIIVAKSAGEAFFKALLLNAAGVALGEIMSSIGFLQLIVFMPLIKVKFPANAKAITDKMIQIATFDLYKTDDLYPMIFEL